MQHDLGDLSAQFDHEELAAAGIVLGAAADRDEGRLRLMVAVAGEASTSAHWVVECAGVVRWVVSDALFVDVRVAVDEHPALLPFTDEQGELYFKGRSSDPVRVADALRAAGARLAAGFLDFETVTTRGGSLPALLAGGYGKLASGPMTLLRAFGEILEADGVSPTLLPMSRPERDEPLSVLELGESWIVAETFSARAS